MPCFYVLDKMTFERPLLWLATERERRREVLCGLKHNDLVQKRGLRL